ncbi:hypothetical protein [Halorientalis salina]|uniref:hypothetical protein n=1 Tax=Halorientalis salina TaxID=2932266 RepID=UPI0010AC8DCE|nr:hypothetical protein [Halorientalis salina]
MAWDIETTGFGWSAEITVSGFWFPHGHATLIINVGPHSVDKQDFVDRLTGVSGVPVSLFVASDEGELLSEMKRVVFERFDREYNRLVAYNADSWKGGFDLPFTRTRCIRQGVDWMFDGVLFADLWEPVKKRLNTTYTAYGSSANVNSLTGSYNLLLGQNNRLPMLLDDLEDHSWYYESPYDPFEDSGSAAAHYREGNLLPVLEHNLADIHRTWELAELIRRFVSSKDISEKKL